MIIVPEKEFDHAKAAEAKAEPAENTDSSFDPPPTYASTSSPPPTTPESPRPLVLKSKPTNYLSLDRSNYPIKGFYTIDPFMSIPQPLLPPLAAGETERGRKNLKLWSKNGSVDVDLTLLADPDKHGIGTDRKKRATLDVGSQNGSVNVKLCRVDATTSGILIPFHLRVSSHNGSVTVGVPHTFEGLLIIHAKNGSVKISDGITERIAMHNEENHVHRCFVGDIASFNDNGDAGWAGDKLDVDAHNGRVKVYFINEAESEPGKSRGGLLSRFLGMS